MVKVFSILIFILSQATAWLVKKAVWKASYLTSDSKSPCLFIMEWVNHIIRPKYAQWVYMPVQYLRVYAMESSTQHFQLIESEHELEKRTTEQSGWTKIGSNNDRRTSMIFKWKKKCVLIECVEMRESHHKTKQLADQTDMMSIPFSSIFAIVAKAKSMYIWKRRRKKRTLTCYTACLCIVSRKERKGDWWSM